jgi:hypothetical protein
MNHSQASDGTPTTDVSGVPGGVPGEGTRTLAIDVGGSGLKAAVLDAAGALIGDRARVPTPYPCPPEVLVRSLGDLVGPLPSYGRVSVGFPGMVRTGCVLSAPNLSRVAGPGSKVSSDLRRAWAGVDLAGALEEALGAPTRVVNDAEMQGAAVVRGRGLELVVTLGTGCGTALFSMGGSPPTSSWASTRSARTGPTTRCWATLHASVRGTPGGTGGWPARCARWMSCCASTASTSGVATPGGSPPLSARTSNWSTTSPASSAVSGCGAPS